MLHVAGEDWDGGVGDIHVPEPDLPSAPELPIASYQGGALPRRRKLSNKKDATSCLRSVYHYQ